MLPLPERVLLASGVTDLRKSIDGLAALVQESLGTNPFALPCLCSAIAGGTSSKCCTGIITAFGCSTAGWNVAPFHGRKAAKRLSPSRFGSCAGC